MTRENASRKLQTLERNGTKMSPFFLPNLLTVYPKRNDKTSMDQPQKLEKENKRT